VDFPGLAPLKDLPGYIPDGYALGMHTLKTYYQREGPKDLSIGVAMQTYSIG
jgi:hypothetical protein